MARLNGGIIGKKNTTSFGKDKITTFTSNGNICTQATTRVVHAKILAGGAGGNTGNVSNGGGGGGAGGLICEHIIVCGSTQYAMVVGGGGNGGSHPQSPPLGNPGSFGSAGTNSTGFGKTATGAPTHLDDAPGPSNRVRASGTSGAPQSNAGGSPTDRGGAGGGGVGAVGGDSPGNSVGGAGGAGTTSPVDCTLHGGGGGGGGWEGGRGTGCAGGGGGGSNYIGGLPNGNAPGYHGSNLSLQNTSSGPGNNSSYARIEWMQPI